VIEAAVRLSERVSEDGLPVTRVDRFALRMSPLPHQRWA
jgi:hypothetical protein